MFEEYKGKWLRDDGRLKGDCDKYVTIYKSGQAAFSEALVDEFALEKTPYVIFFFDSETRRIGFQFEKIKRLHAAKLRHAPKSNMASLRMSGMLKRYGIACDETLHYPASIDPETGLLCISLDDEEGAAS